MRLAVSNIAWLSGEDDLALEKVRAAGATGVEVAPTVLWPEWRRANVLAANEYRKRLDGLGMICPSLQALTFGRPDLSLFSDAQDWPPFLEHMRLVADIAGALGAKVAVFGAPKARRRGALAADDALEVASERLRQVAEFFERAGSCLCIEPNPSDYGCDFITTVAEADELVARVDHPAFGLHLDAAAVRLAEPDPVMAVMSAGPRAQHFHVSEPFLAPVGIEPGIHPRLADALRSTSYAHWYSIEMRRPEGTGLEHLAPAIRFATDVYGTQGA